MLSVSATRCRRLWLSRTAAIERRQIPTRGPPRPERRQPLTWAGSVARLARSSGIGGEVVELVRVGRAVDELPALAADHHDRRDRPLGQILADHLVVAALAQEVGKEAATLDRGRQRRGVAVGGDVHERRQQVDQRDRLGHAPRPGSVPGRARPAARGRRPRRSSSCTRRRARPASRRGRR